MTADHLGDDAPLYPVSVVADRLGVPTATLRSWNQRYGIGPAGHASGRHRLYTEADVAALRRMQELIGRGVSARSAARAAAASQRSDASGLLAAAFALDGATAGLVLDHELRERGVVDTWESLLRPAFAALDTLQVGGTECIDVEHLLSRATTRALQRVSASPEVGSAVAAPIVLACCDGETHTLALEALSAALNQLGHPALMLGASVPAVAISAALGRLSGVRAVVLWSQRESSADVAAVDAVATAGVPVLVAGPGWDAVSLGRRVARPGTLGAAVERLTANP